MLTCCKISAKEYELIYWNQEQIDSLIIEKEITKLTLIRDHRPDGYLPKLINYSELEAFENLSELNFINKISLLSEPFTYDSYLTLPTIPSLKKLAVIDVFKAHSGSQNTNMMKNAISGLFEKINANCQIEELDLTGNLIFFGSLEIDRLNQINQLKNLKKLVLKNTIPYWISLTTSSSVFKALRNFTFLEEVNLDNTLLNKEQIEDILSVPSLKKLTLSAVSYVNFTECPFQTNIEDLHFHGTTLDSLKLSYIFPKLKILVLQDVKTLNSNWNDLAVCSNLEELSLINSTYKGNWRYLADSSLKKISLIGSELTKDAIEQINNMNLTSLTHFTSNIARGIDFSAFSPNLIYLNLSGSNITGGDLKKIGYLHALEELNVSHTSNTGSALSHLKNLYSLKSLDLSELNLEKGDFSILTAHSQLKYLNLSGCYLTLKQIDELAYLIQLEILDLRNLTNSNIGILEIEQLRQKMPDTCILSNCQ